VVNHQPTTTGNALQRPAWCLIAPDGAAGIEAGMTVSLRVRNADETLSTRFSFTRP
jgi:hypothetical protein